MLTRLTRAQTQAQTRKRILTSARQLAAQEGVQACSLERIAEAAGYSKGAVYSNFASKEAILTEALASWLQEEREALAMALAQHRQLDAALAAVSQLYAELLVRGDGRLGAEIRLAATRQDEPGPALRLLLAAHQQQLQQLFSGWLKDCNAPLAVSAKELTTLVGAVSCGLLLETAAQGGGGRQTEIAAAFYSVLRCSCMARVSAHASVGTLG